MLPVRGPSPEEQDSRSRVLSTNDTLEAPKVFLIRGHLGAGRYNSSAGDSTDQSELKMARVAAAVGTGGPVECIPGWWKMWGDCGKVELLAHESPYFLCFLPLLPVPHVFSLSCCPPTNPSSSEPSQ